MAIELKKEIDLPVEAQSLIPLRDFLARCFEEAEVPQADSRAMVVAMDDVLSTTLLGGKEDGRTGMLQVLIDVNDTRVKILVRDNSEGAELREDAQDDVLRQATRQRRELSTSVLRRVMDEVHYHYRRGFQDELELVKFLYNSEADAGGGPDPSEMS